MNCHSYMSHMLTHDSVSPSRTIRRSEALSFTAAALSSLVVRIAAVHVSRGWGAQPSFQMVARVPRNVVRVPK